MSMPTRNVFDPLKHVETILALADCGSVSAAASFIGVTQSAISKALNRAEEDFTQRLFERTTKGVVPTPAGKAVIAHARMIQGHSVDVLNTVDTFKNAPGSLRVGAGASFLDALLPKAIAKVVNRFPKTEIELRVLSFANLFSQLHEGSLDLLFVSEWPGIASQIDIDWTPMINDEVDIVARADHPLAQKAEVQLRDLQSYGWVLGGENDPQQTYLQRAFRAERVVFPGVTVVSHSRTVAIRIVEESDLLTLVPNLRTIEGRNRLARINCPQLKWNRNAGIALRKGFVLPIAGKALVDEITMSCRDYN